MKKNILLIVSLFLGILFCFLYINSTHSSIAAVPTNTQCPNGAPCVCPSPGGACKPGDCSSLGFHWCCPAGTNCKTFFVDSVMKVYCCAPTPTPTPAATATPVATATPAATATATPCPGCTLNIFGFPITTIPPGSAVCVSSTLCTCSINCVGSCNPCPFGQVCVTVNTCGVPTPTPIPTPTPTPGSGCPPPGFPLATVACSTGLAPPEPAIWCCPPSYGCCPSGGKKCKCPGLSICEPCATPTPTPPNNCHWEGSTCTGTCSGTCVPRGSWPSTQCVCCPDGAGGKCPQCSSISVGGGDTCDRGFCPGEVNNTEHCGPPPIGVGACGCKP